ncbi:hypothetical protein AAFF_G00410460 [Aldrovandia affinis]|uniref:Uncharacterized protein n=1 Tax=Aldrovandia affinis TaxID=143900 RepID=A0AAD7SBN2_9TELE|nr:hypothetical protein AAFF_G00410460 [Aldrovandia affinis]
MFIFDDLWKPFLEDLKAAKFLSVLADSATDVSVCDLEGVYVRMLKDWKQKLVGFGTNGAPVMVGRRGGVSTLLREEVPHLINIQCFAHGLELENEEKDLEADQSGGTRWLPHVERALQTLMKDYAVVLAHMENTIETSMHSTAGESLEGFLQDSAEGQFHAVQLQSFSQESRDRFDRLRSCFNDLENDKILQAAVRLVDPREWPTEQADLDSYGADHLRVITDHFADILDWVGCDRGQARHKEWPSAKVVIKALPQVQQARYGQTF